MDRTMKLRALTEAAKTDAAPGVRAEEKDQSAELAKIAAQLEDERSKTLELLKDIVQLRESLKQEQARSADLEAKLTRLATVEENQLAKKNAQLQEEKNRSLEYMRTIEQLRENIKQHQAKTTETADKSAELEAKKKAVAELEAKVKDLTSVLGVISKIAATGKLDISA